MTAKIYRRYTDEEVKAELAKRFGSEKDDTPHGMFSGHVDMLEDRGEQMVGSVVSSRFKSRSIFDGFMGSGGMSRSAQVLGPSTNYGSGGNSLFTTTQPYDPLQSSPDRQMLQGQNRATTNKWWRLFYKMDPVIGAVVELMSELIFGDFQLTGEGVDGSIKETYESMCTDIKLKAKLPCFPREFHIVGEVVPHLQFNGTKGTWSHLTFHNPDNINVIYSPYLDMDPILEFRPDDTLKEIATSAHPKLVQARKFLPKDMVTYLQNGENIPLSSTNVSFIARRQHEYELRGSSLISRLWRTLLLEDSVWNAVIQTARRMAYPLRVVKLGDPATGTIPTAEEEKRVQMLIAQAENDVGCFTPETLVTRYDGSSVPVGDVKVGDLLVDRNNKPSMVTHWWEEFATEMVRIEYQGGEEAFFECTDKHKWPIFGGPRTCYCGCGTPIQKGNILPGHGMRVRGTKYWRPATAPKQLNFVKFRLPVGFDPYQKVRADEIKRGDHLLMPRHFDELDPGISEEQARLLGYYVAEGSTVNYSSGDRKGSVLSFSYDEKDTLALDAVNIINELVPDSGVKSYDRPSVTSVQSFRNNGKPLQEWLVTHGGTGARTKKLSDAVMCWPLRLKRAFLIGYLRGDGSVTQHVDRDSIAVSTASMQLAYQLQKLIAQLGAYAPVYKTENNHGSFEKAGALWTLTLHGDLADAMLDEAFGKPQAPRTKRAPTLWWVDENYVYVRVTKVTKTSHAEPVRVINMTVAGDHSYQVKNIGTYNSTMTYNYQIAFELVGGPERVINFGQYYDIIEKIKMVALGVSKAFVLGETSYSSSAAGLTVFLQRLKNMREFFVNEWLIPRYFLPIAKVNDWVKPSHKQQEGGRVRRRANLNQRYAQQLQDGSYYTNDLDEDDSSRYILPKIEWAKSLDPQIDNERLQAIVALETQLGLKVTDQVKFACAGLEPDQQQKQLVEELKTKRDLAGEDPQLQAILGLIPPPGGEMPGGGGMVSPGIPPESFGLPGGGEEMPADTSGGGDMGAPPAAPGAPGGETGAPPSPEGASVNVDADKGKGSTSPGAKKNDATGGALKYWPKDTIAPLSTLFDTMDATECADHDVWAVMLKDSAVSSAIGTQDPYEVWTAIENWLVDENYPTQAITELRDTLTAQHKFATAHTSRAYTIDDLNAVAAKVGLNLKSLEGSVDRPVAFRSKRRR